LVSATLRANQIVRITLKFLEGGSYRSLSRNEIEDVLGPDWVTSLI